jgi:hypothetical protein
MQAAELSSCSLNLIHPKARSIVAMRIIARAISGIQHPIARPNFLCLPDRVNRIPIFREILLFAPEMPRARFQENEKPNYPWEDLTAPSNHFWAEMSMKIFSGERLADTEKEWYWGYSVLMLINSPISQI